MSTPIHTTGSISTEGPVPVPMGDVDIRSRSYFEKSCDFHKIMQSAVPSVETLENSDDDDSEDGLGDEVKRLRVRIIKWTFASEKQAEDPDLPQGRAENQQVNIMSSLLSIQFK